MFAIGDHKGRECGRRGKTTRLSHTNIGRRLAYHIPTTKPVQTANTPAHLMAPHAAGDGGTQNRGMARGVSRHVHTQALR
ncbi:hypothetical protein Bpfe_003296 [Biomphalaria pfeifferi]|uniref:Uncharacterized protein n=1 Tax=Biomphalaria pfeifferi TaxID=112525 RepID=A0AAD8C6V2_BIOPF|nr:hypothetical protein Bpfe_003296 [Biomphalaria pfeifferi]